MSRATHHEAEEHAGGGEEVPDVVVVVEAEDLAVAVLGARLGRAQLAGGGSGRYEGRRLGLSRSVSTTHVLRFFHDVYELFALFASFS